MPKISSKPIEWRIAVLALVLLIGTTSLLTAFAEEYSVGSGADDWWITYPDGHTDPGATVSHPGWVESALATRPVLIYGHLECDYCRPQKEAVEKVLEDYGSDFAYFDILGDGSDSRAGDLTVYDPNGGKNLVPLTVIVTKVIGPDGDVQIGWHSTEDITGEEWIRSYMDDALSKYNENQSD